MPAWSRCWRRTRTPSSPWTWSGARWRCRTARRRASRSTRSRARCCSRAPTSSASCSPSPRPWPPTRPAIRRGSTPPRRLVADPDAAAGGTTPGVAFELEPMGPVTARMEAPASKSVTNRMLVCAALGDGVSLLRRPLESDDSAAMREALGALGAPVTELAGPAWRVAGTGGRLASPAVPLDARGSGTTMRFLAALAPLTAAGATVTGRPGLLLRPIGALVAALRELGAQVDDRDGFPPVSAAGGGLEGGHAAVDAGASSQFPSAILLAAPYAREPVTLSTARLGSLQPGARVRALLAAMGATGTRDGSALTASGPETLAPIDA